GYTLLFDYLGQRSSMQLATRIDNNEYFDNDLIEIKMKLDLPYMTTAAEYENLAGEININGTNHNFVKRKISNDTLYLLCLPNHKKDQLLDAAGTYAASANDFDATHKNDSQVKKSASFNQFQEQHHAFAFTPPSRIAETAYASISATLPDSFVETNGKPPRLNS
ncbi:MAG: hypothetical protein ABW174_11980, partial [Flavitalea sp.]